MSNIRTQIGKVVGKTLNDYHKRVKPKIDELKFKEEYQGRIIDCMVGEVDDNYIETPETDSSIVKLEHSKEGLVKVPSIKGKTILVDEDGNETDTPREGCRLVSVGEEEDNKLIILSKNKNLFDGKLIDDSYVDINGNIVVDSGMVRTDYIKVSPLKTYTWTIKNTTSFIYCRLFDKDKKFIKALQINASRQYSFMTTENTMYVIMCCIGDLTTIIEPQLIEGDVSSTYIESQFNKTEILLDEPLRSLPNGVCDEIVGNQLIRKVGKYVLDGSISYNCVYSLEKGYERVNILTRQANFTNKYHNQLCVKSDRLQTVTNSNLHGSVILDTVGITGDNYIRLHLDLKHFDNIRSDNHSVVLKEWLKENHIVVYYPLAEPIIEELPNGITLQGFDNTTMYIENSITPTVTYGYNTLIPYKEELSKQKEEVETNTLDIEQNIIPYLMDMEFNLMLMEDNE